MDVYIFVFAFFVCVYCTTYVHLSQQKYTHGGKVSQHRFLKYPGASYHHVNEQGSRADTKMSYGSLGYHEHKINRRLD